MPTTYKGLTVPLATDLADGPKLGRDIADSLGASDALVALANQITALIPAGTIRESVNAASEVGWLNMGHGAINAVPNAQTLYPALWAVVPAAWKSGSTLNLPDWGNRVLEGAGLVPVGVNGGANSRTLTTAHMPAHNHDLGNHTHTNNTHAHSADLSFAGVHGHNNPNRYLHYLGDGAGVGGIQLDTWDGGVAGPAVDYPAIIDGAGDTANGLHNHVVTVNAAGIAMGGPSPAVTSTAGSGGALDTTPACVGIYFKIKAH
jgi:microcystin-dependent protein